MKLLLHSCCAPCSIQCAGALAEEGIRPELYWYNPNIHPFTEYRSRLDSLRSFAEARELSLVVEDDYGLRSFVSTVENDIYIGFSNNTSRFLSQSSRRHEGRRKIRKLRSSLCASVRFVREKWGRKLAHMTPVARRCAFCYRLRLEKTAALAVEKGCDAFSTTLLISPHQNHELIREIGESLATRYGVSFLYRDFRPRFRQGQNQAREAGYYMQKYCGCIYSEEERYR